MIFHNSGYRSAVATEASYTESLRMLTTNFASVIELNRLFADLVIQAKGKLSLLSLQAASWVFYPSQPIQFTVQQRLL
jgi:hypothetical protein